MKIVQPKKINNLIKTEQLLEEIQDEELINKQIENIILQDIEIYDTKFAILKMVNVEITNSKLEKNTFTDITFENCNFSNTSFENSIFVRCEFINCKMTGCNFIEARLYNVSFIETNINYANLSTTSMENVLFKNTGLRNSNFQENSLKNIYFEKADLTQTMITKTSLKNIDLSDSIIEEMAISIDDIRGATINQFQSVDLLYLIGVKIKTIPAYNINKQFHPKENEWVGYVIEVEGTRYYIAGDTDITPENKQVKCDVALIPVGGTYTMNYQEGAELVNTIMPKIAIPTHYGSVVGEKEDGEKFKQLLNQEIKCEILIK